MAAAVLDKEQLYDFLICAGRIPPQLRNTAASSSLRVVTLASVTSVFIQDNVSMG